ncbi:hypothetical protein NDU88_003528 [Pleurodeles waltl]|uniref:Uncharacterized protein n=1 Tax=Pleurodeles waltl TaxID=8319 RepID=A0AAV7WSL1_PLEWA|nr:hypothetical protein NDU88_003528 [Pleurodeles waltl]
MVGYDCNRLDGTCFYVSFPAGQHPSEKVYMACHRQGCVDPGGLRQAEHPLSQTVGGPKTRARKTAEAQLGMASQRGRGAFSDPDPPDGPHTGSGLSGTRWALEGITAATGG